MPILKNKEKYAVNYYYQLYFILFPSMNYLPLKLLIHICVFLISTVLENVTRKSALRGTYTPGW